MVGAGGGEDDLPRQTSASAATQTSATGEETHRPQSHDAAAGPCRFRSPSTTPDQPNAETRRGLVEKPEGSELHKSMKPVTAD